MARERVALDADYLVRAYEAGASEKKLADELGVSRSAIRRRLVARNVKPRGRSEAELLKWSAIKRDRALVERQCGSAWNAARGRIHTLEEKSARAAGGGRRIGKHEDNIAGLLDAAGCAVTRQLPWGPYNIDLAAHEERVAIEVLGSIVTHAARDRIRERTEYLLNGGWCVLFVYVGPLWGRRHVKVDGAFVTDEIVSLVERARRHEPVHGCYRVIRGDGEPTSMLRKYLNDLPVVPGAVGTVEGALNHDA